MSANDLKIRNLDFIRQIPKIGARLFEAITDIKSGVSTMASQGNLNPNGDVPAPPNVQAVTATGANGVMTVSIQDQSASLNRDVQYVIEHADNPAFVNAQQRFIGATRSHSEFIGNATRYVRAYSTYGASSNSNHVYHGSATVPAPVAGGGFVGPPVYQPSQGAGTGAAGQSGYGQGPTQSRDQTNGFDWTLQRPQGSTGGFRGQGTPAGNGASGTSGGAGGGGSVTVSEPVIAASETLTAIAGTGNAITGVTATPYSARAIGFVIRYIPIHANSGATTINENSIGAVAITDNGGNALVGGEFVIGKAEFLVYDGTAYQIVGIVAPIGATVLASDSHGVPSVAPLTKGNIWAGSGSNLPVALSPGADGKVLTANSGAANGVDYEAPIALTTTGTSGVATLTPGTPYALNVPNYSGGGSTGTFVPTISFGGSSTGITYSAQNGNYFRIGSIVIATIDMALSSIGAVMGNAVLDGLPSAVSAADLVGGSVNYSSGMLLLSSPTCIPVVGSTTVNLYNTGATGSANLTNSNFTNTSRIIVQVIYGF